MRLYALLLFAVMGFPSKESGAGSSGVLPSTWTQGALVAQTLNLDGAGNIKASAVGANEVVGYRNENVFNPDHYSKATIRGGLASGTNYAEVWARVSGTNTTLNGYAFFTDGVSGTGHTAIDKWTNGVGAEIAAIATTFATGDEMKIAVVGPLISVYKNGALVGSFSDASFPTGSPGLAVVNSGTNNVVLQNFEGGNVAEAYSIGTRRIGPVNRGPFDRLGFLKRNEGATLAPIVGAVTITTDVGSLVLDGFAPTIGIPVTVTPGVGSLALTGNAPTFPTTLTIGLGQLTLSGFAPTIGAPVTVVPGFGQLSLTGLAPTFPRTILPGTGSLTLSGLAPTFPRTIIPGFGALTLNGFAPSFSFTIGGFTLQPGLGSLVLTGFAPSLGLPKTVVPGTGVLALSGFAPAIGVPVTLRPGFGQLTLTGFGPSISFTPPGLTLLPGTGALVLTGYAPSIGNLTFRFAGGPVMTATITAQGVIIASVTGGSVLTETITGSPA